MIREIIQMSVAVAADGMIQTAVAMDGTAWQRLISIKQFGIGHDSGGWTEWQQIPPLPEPTND